MSGAPLVRMGSREIIGVLYGHNEAETIEEFGTRDPETGERLRPEVVRRNYFAAAHYTWNLQTLKGEATNGRPLFEYLRELEEPEVNEGDYG
jgi:homospermidine synthase